MRILSLIFLVLCMLAPIAAWAQSKDPLSYPLRQLGGVLFMTLLGGFVGWYMKVRKGEVPGSSLFALIGEMATSSLAGLGAFLVCDYLNVPIGMTAAIAGVCGYMGGRAIDMAEQMLLKRAERLAAKE